MWEEKAQGNKYNIKYSCGSSNLKIGAKKFLCKEKCRHYQHLYSIFTESAVVLLWGKNPPVFGTKSMKEKKS